MMIFLALTAQVLVLMVEVVVAEAGEVVEDRAFLGHHRLR